MSIRSQLPAPTPFISIREVLEGLAAEEDLPFEAVAKFLWDRIESMPPAILYDGLTFEANNVPTQYIANLLDAAENYSLIGIPLEECERAPLIPSEYEYRQHGWHRDELASWLKQNGVSAAICKENKQMGPAGEDAPPAPIAPGEASAPVPEVVRKFATYEDSVLMSISDAMAVTGLSRATISRRIDDGSLEKIKIGGAVRITVGSLRKIMR